MAMLENIFNSRLGSMVPDVNVNMKAFDNLSIVKRIYGQAQAAYEDLNRIPPLIYTIPATGPSVLPPPVLGFARDVQATSGYSEAVGRDEFIAEILRNGVARPTWFKVFITKPSDSGGEERNVSLFCEAAEFPSLNISTDMLRTYGAPVEYPYMRTYDPVNMTFLIDTGMEIKLFFDKWINLIVDDPGTNDVAFASDYATTITIFQLDPSNTNFVYGVTLYDAYPKLVAALPVNHAARNDIHRLQVTFVYTKMTSLHIPINQAIPETGINDAQQNLSSPSESNPFGVPYSSSSLESSFLGSNYGSISNATSSVANQVLNYTRPLSSAVSTAYQAGKSALSSFFS